MKHSISILKRVLCYNYLYFMIDHAFAWKLGVDQGYALLFWRLFLSHGLLYICKYELPVYNFFFNFKY